MMGPMAADTDSVHPFRPQRSKPLRQSACVAACVLVLLGVPSLGLPGTARAAETQSMQVVGAIPIDAEVRRKSVLKDLAIQEALWQGVSRVADELLEEQAIGLIPVEGETNGEGAEAGEGAALTRSERVRAALGEDMVRYTKSFRILDDQGERPVMFTSNPDAATEYVVIVEVEVDAEHVASRLRSVGLLVEVAQDSLTGTQVEVQGLMQYAGLMRLVEVLLGRGVGAESVTPREFQRGLARLQVRAEWGAEELLSRLLAAAPPELRIRPVSVIEEFGETGVFGELVPPRSELVLAVQWTPPEPEAEPDDSPPARRRR